MPERPFQGRFDVGLDGNVKIVGSVPVLPDGRPLVEEQTDLDKISELWELFVSRHGVKDPKRRRDIINEVVDKSGRMLHLK